MTLLDQARESDEPWAKALVELADAVAADYPDALSADVYDALEKLRR